MKLTVAKLFYKPFSVLFGVLGGLVAGALFKKLWVALAGEAEPPSATRADRSWIEVLTAATIEGAIYALVKAAADRGGAVAFESATGVWPGESNGE